MSYGYDARQMLASATGPWGTLGWTYDAVGNRASETLTPTGGSATVDTYTYAPDSNHLTEVLGLSGSRDYSYDANGNTAGELRTVGLGGTWAYTYNGANRLTAVDLGGVRQADYLYNALGQQVSRDNGQVTLSVHDLDGNRIAEYDGSGALLREYIWLDGRPPERHRGHRRGRADLLDPLGPDRAAGAGDRRHRRGGLGGALSPLSRGIDTVFAGSLARGQNLRFPGQRSAVPVIRRVRIHAHPSAVPASAWP